MFWSISMYFGEGSHKQVCMGTSIYNKRWYGQLETSNYEEKVKPQATTRPIQSRMVTIIKGRGMAMTMRTTNYFVKIARGDTMGNAR